MLQISDINDMRRWSQATKAAGLSIAFVPTMGFLHEGHLSLIRQARSRGNRVVVSIFVNELQFNESEDFKKYPRDHKRDLQLLTQENVDAVFIPSAEQVYPYGMPEIRISYPALMNKLCGAGRPGHFEGVLVIVHNLFQWIDPDYAVFGLKDYQQYLLIKKMTFDLSLNVEILPGELVREKDGLALSSRNVRLSSTGREKALLISRALFQLKELYAAEPVSIKELKAAFQERLDSLDIEYAGIYNAETLEQARSSAEKLLAAAAVRIDNVRLIDNILLN